MRSDTVVWAAATYLTLFAGSSYAFPNYYQFVMGVMLLGGVLALSALPREAPAGPDRAEPT